MDRNHRFEGKVVFITGVARGQGRNHAVRFAEEGARIIGVDLCHDLEHAPYPMSTPEDLAETVRLVEAAGAAMHAEQADVRDRKELKRIVNAGIDKFGRLDVILANAGTYSPMPVQFVADDSWNETVDINLTGVFHTVKVGLRQLVEQNEGGAIVITSSTAGIKGFYGAPAYSAAKHGVVGLMRSLALELAPNQVRVNSVHPTSVYTPMIINEVFPKLVRMDLADPGEAETAEFLKDMQPMGNPWIHVDDVSNTILFLCSDDARYITGSSIAIDAGAMTK